MKSPFYRRLALIPLIAFAAGCASFEEIRTRAANGDPAAQYNVGMTYAKGSDEILKDVAAAEEYLKKAADNGHKHAKRALFLLWMENSMLEHADDIIAGYPGVAEKTFMSWSMDGDLLKVGPDFATALVKAEKLDQGEKFTLMMLKLEKDMFYSGNPHYALNETNEGATLLRRAKEIDSMLDKRKAEIEDLRQKRISEEFVAMGKAAVERIDREMVEAMAKRETEPYMSSYFATQEKEAKNKLKAEVERIDREMREARNERGFKWEYAERAKNELAAMANDAEKKFKTNAESGLKRAEAKVREQAETAREQAEASAAGAASGGGLFAQANREAYNAVAAYMDVWQGYFGNWKTLISAFPAPDPNGNSSIEVNPAARSVSFKMRIEVNEEAYRKWADESSKRFSEAGFSAVEDGNLRIGGNTYALTPVQTTALQNWVDGVEGSRRRIVFRAMLLDSKGEVVRSQDIAERNATRTVKEKTTGNEWGRLAMLEGSDAVAFAADVAALTGEDPYEKGKVYNVYTDVWKTGREFPLKDAPDAMCRLKESPKDWAKEVEFKTDDEGILETVSFEKLTDDEMARAESVKCVVLDDGDVEDERIAAAKDGWGGLEKEAGNAVLQILADMAKVPGMNCALGRHTVSQSAWKSIMKSSPEHGKNGDADGDDPMVGAGYKDVVEFIARLNAHPDIANAGIRFRLPNKGEWAKAALAGSPGKFKDFISRYGEKPSEQGGFNAWGFHDMLVGCWERIGKIDKGANGWTDDGWYACSGSEVEGDEIQLLECPIRYRSENAYVEKKRVGLRLCADWSDSMKTAVETAVKQLSKK